MGGISRVACCPARVVDTSSVTSPRRSDTADRTCGTSPAVSIAPTSRLTRRLRASAAASAGSASLSGCSADAVAARAQLLRSQRCSDPDQRRQHLPGDVVDGHRHLPHGRQVIAVRREMGRQRPHRAARPGARSRGVLLQLGHQGRGAGGVSIEHGWSAPDRLAAARRPARAWRSSRSSRARRPRRAAGAPGPPQRAVRSARSGGDRREAGGAAWVRRTAGPSRRAARSAATASASAGSAAAASSPAVAPAASSITSVVRRCTAGGEP